MHKTTLSEYIKENQGIITTIALFSTLAAFFLKFLEIKDESKFADDFLPFVTFLIVIFLLIYLYVDLEKLKQKEKSLVFFKSLLLVFLFFIFMFILEYWPNTAVLIKKIVILLIILYLFLGLFKIGIENKWFIGTSLVIVLSLSIIIMLSLLLVISTDNCVKNEYALFTIYSFIFSILIFIVSGVVRGYSKVFETVGNTKWTGKGQRQKLLKRLGIIFLVLIIAIIILWIISQFLPVDLIVKAIVKLIFLPRTLFC